MIETRGLTKYYDSHVAVQDVSFCVGDGETVGFLGANGAGKTTTMRILTGFLRPSSGRATVAGFDILEETREAQRRIGYLPETTPLYLDMRVMEFLTYRARVKGVPKAERRASIGSALERTRTTDVANRIIGHLSKGYRQRVGLADCLLGKPRLLILDEPTVGLDPNQVLETRELIRALGRDTTIFLSTHILFEVEQICARVIVIDRGRIVAEARTDEIERLYAGPRRLAVELGLEENVTPALAGLPGVTAAERLGRTADGAWEYRLVCAPGVDPRRDVARLAAAQGWLLQEVRLEPVRLEEIFAQLTRGSEDAPSVAPPSTAAPREGRDAAGESFRRSDAAATDSESTPKPDDSVSRGDS